MADGPLMHNFPPVLDYRGEKDDRVWYMREKVLEDAVAELRVERDFLREMLRAVLNRESEL